MEGRLEDSDLDIIIDSLNHYKSRAENYDGYPSYEFKQQQLQRIESTMRKVRELRQNCLPINANINQSMLFIIPALNMKYCSRF